MGIINIISDRKNITLNSDVILYIIMNGKIAEIHIVGGKVYQTRIALKNLEGLLKEDFVKVHRGCIVSVKAIHEVTDMVNLSNGEELPYTVRKKMCIRDRYYRHNDPVYTDSAMEIFLAFPEENQALSNECMYTNFEINAYGAMLANY